jgi:hypothetical protein
MRSIRAPGLGLFFLALSVSRVHAQDSATGSCFDSGGELSSADSIEPSPAAMSSPSQFRN